MTKKQLIFLMGTVIGIQIGLMYKFGIEPINVIFLSISCFLLGGFLNDDL